MKRKEFLTTTLVTLAGSYVYGKSHNILNALSSEESQSNMLAKVSGALEKKFQDLIQWLKINGWADYLSQAVDVNLNLSGAELRAALIKNISKEKLTVLRNRVNGGFDDFGGTSLIKPGFPAYSLLYHALASPRVRSENFKSYPSLAQIDTLENYIYALSDWNDLKTVYNVKANADLVLAVFAYEYRPAFKTPHHKQADLVFSRTGIARIGNKPLNFDSSNRCYVNKPAEPQNKNEISVVPARYGLFIAKKVKRNEIELMTTGISKGDANDDRRDESETFLYPIRKIFNNDLLINEQAIKFREVHKSEKLSKLFLNKKINTLDNMQPLVRESKELIEQDDSMRLSESSFLVISKMAELIRQAKVREKGLYFLVPQATDLNRYFTTYSTQGVKDIELLSNGQRSLNQYSAARNQAMFINVTHKISQLNEGYEQLKKDSTNAFEKEINDGGYYAPLFEDSICDGRVEVDMSLLNLKALNGIARKCLPAFSIVTAPDFFPQVDPFDLVDFDIAPGVSDESNFFEGGIASLSVSRIRPNPKAINSENDVTAKTYSAVVSNKYELGFDALKAGGMDYKNPSADKGYYVSGFLPDVSSSVFAPGWDVTYSKDNRFGNEIYIGTEGLGSPFIEDMKYCSALNGMWPATSPDSARTYQGSHEPTYRNPTAIPLLDDELGFHKDSNCTDKTLLNTMGWDGEQGPYLEKVQGVWKINFTDVGRADAVQNALEGKLDMSKLRDVTSAELIARMACLRLCIKKLPGFYFEENIPKIKMVGNTYLWLISAEKVNWGMSDAVGHGIPVDLIGTNKEWITKKSNAKINGAGYLFLFANSSHDSPDQREWVDPKRRRLDCQDLFVCQVTGKSVAWRKILEPGSDWQF